VPGLENVWENDAPGSRAPELHEPSLAVHVWAVPSRLVAVTRAPGETRVVAGEKVKSAIVICAGWGLGAVVVGAAVVGGAVVGWGAGAGAGRAVVGGAGALVVGAGAAAAARVVGADVALVVAGAASG
jgi:hypothetical protein